MSIALCNPDAFYPLRSLVSGPLRDATDLPKIERLIRSIILHDEVQMVMDPWPDPGEEHEWTEEEIAAGGRNVIVAVGPTINQYQDLDLLDYLPYIEAPPVELSAELVQVIQDHAGVVNGPYFDAHARFISNIVATVQQGGSIVCEDSIANEVIDVSSRLPEGIFDELDRGWTELVTAADGGDVGLVVPPFLAIVLHRCANRDGILPVLADVKQEFQAARRALWTLLADMRAARTIQQFNEIKSELARVGELMNPQHEWPSLWPVRTLWQITAAAVGGAVVGGMARAPVAGAAAAAVNQAARAITGNQTEFRLLFRRGAFDLARRVNQNLQGIERMPDLLRPLLTASERQDLRLR